MKPPLSDTLVICDMDNTLLTAKEGIPACNRAVIQLYTGMGGLFTVATGRPPESIRAALGNIRLSLPAISCNGALLYDFSAESVLHRSTLNREQATTAILDILNKFPHIGVEVMAGNGEMFVIHANEVTHAHQVDEHLGSIACPVESVPDGWVKASGLHDLCALMSKSMKNTVVIGDYYNDLEIMREAGYAVAVANAPAEVKAAADHVTTCTCAEGAVGEYLYSLIGRAEGREV